MENSGAPHPSTLVRFIDLPVSSSISFAIAICNGWLASRYVFTSQPFTTQVANIPACLPLQFAANEVAGLAPKAIRALRSSGRSGVFCKSDSDNPALFNISRATT